ncbi:hypothetical protein WCD74_28790 [Actinomycetospora sp. OC33-EN08]|uniref:Uncharacterized protein n=1 Tax=Actinomycetospora aurantiaca TaxID=3129233 RepID=A0ABU8MWT6_9PSEU
MTADQSSRCEVCRACLADDRPRRDRPRCAEHLAQQPLFPLTALRRPRAGSRKATS